MSSAISFCGILNAFFKFKNNSKKKHIFEVTQVTYDKIHIHCKLRLAMAFSYLVKTKTFLQMMTAKKLPFIARTTKYIDNRWLSLLGFSFS